MALSRRIAWIILLGAILTAGILRQFHETIPSSPFLPWPIRSLLFFLVLILFLSFARGWGSRQEIPYAGAGLKRVNFLAFLPLLLALMLEKWVSITFYGPLFYRINGESITPATFDALYVIESAAGLFLITLLLIPLFRRLFPMLRRYLAPQGIALAAAGILIALAGLFGGLALLLSLAGAEGFRLRWTGFGRVTVLILLGQGLIAFAEEFYYRGILQTELAFLLPSLGVAGRRVRWLSAVFLISAAFGLEHLVWTDTYSEDLRRFLFTFGCSFFLGTLLVLLDNLWLNASCHLVLNLFSLGLDPATRGSGLQFVNEQGQPLFEASIYIFLFLILLFVFTYARIAMARRQETRRPASGAAPVR